MSVQGHPYIVTAALTTGLFCILSWAFAQQVEEKERPGALATFIEAVLVAAVFTAIAYGARVVTGVQP